MGLHWFLVACAGVVLVTTQGTARPQPVNTSMRAVLAKATSHLREYQAALRFVLADEATVQEVFNTHGRRVARRETSSEFFLTYVEADGGWLSVREITVVDGAPVEDRENLRALLNRGSIARIGRAVADRNARYNIGSIARNFNDPMLAMVILDPKHQGRFRFERRLVEPTDTGTRVTLAFTERDRPTLVRGADGRPIVARGELTLDAATGRLHRSVIALKDRSTTATLTATFEANEKFGLWLPATLTERYEHATSDLREQVVAESTYTNYRKFEVNVIIR